MVQTALGPWAGAYIAVPGGHCAEGAIMDLGDPIRVLEVEPVFVPVPEPVEFPAEVPAPAEEPAEVGV